MSTIQGLTLVRPQDQDIAERLLARTRRDSETGCLLWTGARIWTNYGLISVKKWAPPGRKYWHKRTHRVSFELFVGPIPDGYDVEHACHTRSNCDLRDQCPHRLCLEPTHLEAITHRENLLRGNGFPGRQTRQTHCLRNHPLAGPGADVYVSPVGRRQCRTCVSITTAARRSTDQEK